MTNNLKPDANEQMREKAQHIIREKCFASRIMHLDDVIRVEDLIVAALQEAHAAGRQEILDRLPSDIEIAEAYDAKRAAVGGRGDTTHMMAGWIEACRYLKSRLLGEGK